MTALPFILLAFVPLSLIGLVVEILRRWETTGEPGAQAPGRERLLRSAGQFASTRIAALDGKLMETVVVIACLPPLLSFGYFYPLNLMPSLPAELWPVIFWGGSGLYLGLLIRLLALRRERCRWRLTLRGERAVGEELNQLLATGCQVFHDFPAGEGWHVDHVIVGPPGVFAVDTRTRRNHKLPGNRTAYKVDYDGRSLRFEGSDYWDTDELDQARGQAVRLGRFLSQSLGAKVEVKPILTFPGWHVTSQRLGDVRVVNPTAIRACISAEDPSTLPPELIGAVACLLEQKCRDVEF